MPGVHAVMTAAEIGARCRSFRCGSRTCRSSRATFSRSSPATRSAMSASRSRWWSRRRKALAEDALEAIEVDIERLPALPDRHVAAADRSLLFEACGSNRAVRYTASFGDADAAFAKAEYTRKETFRCHRLTGLPLETRGQIAEWDAGKKRLTVFGATKVLFFNRRTLAPMLGVTEDDIDMIEVDVGGGFGVKGEFYPEDFLIPFAARLVGRPVKWIEDRREHLDRHQPFARGRLRAGDRLQARRHDPRHARPRLRRHGRLYPHQRRRGAGQGRAVPAGALSHPRRRADGGGLRHQQDAGRHLARAGAVRGEFLPRAAARHRGGRSRPRSDGVPPQESDQGGGAAVRTPASSCPTSRRPISTPATITSPSSARSTEIGWDKNKSMQGRLIDGRYHGLAAVPFVESGGSGKENSRLVIETGRLGQRLCRLVGAGAGARDDARPGRRRHAEAAVRAHQDPAWLDDLSARGLRHVRLALDGGRRLRR